MRSDPGTAAVKALALLKLWNFPNNYTLGKRFTELMVRDLDKGWRCLFDPTYVFQSGPSLFPSFRYATSPPILAQQALPSSDLLSSGQWRERPAQDMLATWQVRSRLGHLGLISFLTAPVRISPRKLLVLMIFSSFSLIRTGRICSGLWDGILPTRHSGLA